MTILRIFIENAELADVSWQRVDNQVESELYETSFAELLQIPFDSLEVYLAPVMASVIKINLDAISNRKVNEEYLLGLVEEQLADDIESCKPILLRLTDGEAFVAILERTFYLNLLKHLADYVKKVKFIQPFPYALEYEESIWTLYMVNDNKFIRTSHYEYYILDDNEPLPQMLEEMLIDYKEEKLIVYSDNPNLIDIIENKYKVKCVASNSYNYDTLTWNFYNEKSKRFNLKINPQMVGQFKRLAKVLSICLSVFVIMWLSNLGYLLIKQASLSNQISNDLTGIISSNTSTMKTNLLSQVDDKLTDMEHEKGLYAPSDMSSLLDVFLRTMPNIDNNMILGIQYTGTTLNLFLNSQFDASQFSNAKTIFSTKRILAKINDYKTYQASQTTGSSQNNNSGGIADTNSDNSSGGSSNAALQDTSWVVTLQVISRSDSLDAATK